MGRLTREACARAGVALPGAALALATVLWLLMAAVDRHPFWRVEPMTLSEAVAARDFGEVARLLASGRDPNARYAIRAGMIGRAARELTPMETAVAAGREEMMSILSYAGAHQPPAPAANGGR
jgi:hypothetical protein